MTIHATRVLFLHVVTTSWKRNVLCLHTATMNFSTRVLFLRVATTKWKWNKFTGTLSTYSYDEILYTGTVSTCSYDIMEMKQIYWYFVYVWLRWTSLHNRSLQHLYSLFHMICAWNLNWTGAWFNTWHSSRWVSPTSFPASASTQTFPFHNIPH